MGLAVAICIAGQYRTHAHTMRSFQQHVVWPLQRRFDVVDVFHVLGMLDIGHLLANRGLRRIEIDSDRRNRSQQFVRFELCRKMMATTGTPYVWAIRTRPDILFAEDLRLEGLSAEHVHAKLRCANRDVYHSLHLHEIAQELQHVKTCAVPLPWGCRKVSTRLDDQFAVVPAKYIAAYFLSHHERTWRTNLTLEDDTFPQYAPQTVVYTLTRSLVDQGVEFKPLKLGFCLQKSAIPCSVKDDKVLSCKLRKWGRKATVDDPQRINT